MCKKRPLHNPPENAPAGAHGASSSVGRTLSAGNCSPNASKTRCRNPCLPIDSAVASILSGSMPLKFPKPYTEGVLRPNWCKHAIASTHHKIALFQQAHNVRIEGLILAIPLHLRHNTRCNDAHGAPWTRLAC